MLPRWKGSYLIILKGSCPRMLLMYILCLLYVRTYYSCLVYNISHAWSNNQQQHCN